MVDTDSPTLEGPPSAFIWRAVPSVAALATGSALGWFFRRELLKLLVEPWLDANRILEGHPSSEEVALWFGLIAATAAIVLALPWLTALAWGVVNPRSDALSGRSGYTFIVCSYAAIGIGLWLATFVAFQAFLVQQREAWQGVVAAPWAFIESELGISVGFAFVFQLGALLCSLARVRSL